MPPALAAGRASLPSITGLSSSQGGGAYNRYEVVGWGSPVRHNNYPPDGRWYSNPPQLVHELRGADGQKLIPKLADAIDSYPWQDYGTYQVWPGPNSNTFVAHVLREVPQVARRNAQCWCRQGFHRPGSHRPFHAIRHRLADIIRWLSRRGGGLGRGA